MKSSQNLYATSSGLVLDRAGSLSARARPRNRSCHLRHTRIFGPLVNGSTTVVAKSVAALGFAASPIISRWFTWLSVLFFLEQAIETIVGFGQLSFIAPGGIMNVYLCGVMGFLWTGGVAHWARKQCKLTNRKEKEQSN